ncbi:RAD50-interacting protein 1 isoform X1 [Hydra vulgaris]|uniref:RAD50-interacting protein 1 isoform X1 n=1 Tax=Hydra vulgaris TaxID=6087 RepID=UPI001F5EA6F2|nr:RAD50-interacting protein 1 isoform X1 [Hydra vulgaris]
MTPEDGVNAVTELFDAIFGEDYECLRNVECILEEYINKKKKLLFTIGENEKNEVLDLQKTVETCHILEEDITTIANNLKNVFSLYDNHKHVFSSLLTSLTELSKEFNHERNKYLYLLWLKEVDDLSEETLSCIEKKNFMQAINSHKKLFIISSTLQNSSCNNLKTYSYKKCELLYTELKAHLSSALEVVLKSISYPFATGVRSPHFNKKDGTEDHLKSLVASIAQLNSLSSLKYGNLLNELLVKPIKKRFKYHFYGNRHTNNLDKPEWYYTQVLNWIHDHASFLDFIQSILTENKSSCIIKKEFCLSLIKLCEVKLQSVLSGCYDNDLRLAHLIDETILFEKEVQVCIPNYSQHDGCLKVLLTEENLLLWIGLEKRFGLGFISDVLRSDNEKSWQSRLNSLLSDYNNSIIYFVPKCVEDFMTLITVMSDRHRTFKEPVAEAKFFSLLINLLDTFINQLKSLCFQPSSPQYFSIMNGVIYMQQVLQEWSTDLYFIQMHAYECGNNAQNTDKTVFEDHLVSLESFSKNLVQSLVEHIKHSLQSDVKKYQAEKWHSLPLPKDILMPSISPSACNVFLFVKNYLHSLEQKLCTEIFERVWKQSAKMLDEMIFYNVVLESHFNGGGAAQLQYDINKLYTLFSNYSKRPETYFKLLKDSCVLLNILPGTAILLKQNFKQADELKTGEEKESLVRTSLTDIGICNLSFSCAHQLLNSRIDWPRVL